MRDDLTGVPLAGVLVFTDGAQNSGPAWTGSVLEYQAAKVPVYAVGLGRSGRAEDIELGRVEVPASVLEGASVVVDVPITQWGFGGQHVQLDVEEDGRIVARRDVVLAAGRRRAPARGST